MAMLATVQTDSTNDSLERANSLLIHCEFSKCLEICAKSLENCGSQTDLEDQSVRSRKESLCIVALQAYAESNRWMEVESFLEFWYENLQTLPPSLVKMSLLLFVKVGEFERADILASSWLENKDNMKQTSEYKSVLEVLIRRVLSANGMCDKAHYIVQNSDILTDEEKQDLMRSAVLISEHSNMMSDNSLENQSETEPKDEQTLTSRQRTRSIFVLQKISDMLNTLVTRIRHWSQHPQSYCNIRQVVKCLTLLVFILSLIFMNGNAAVVSPGSGVSQLLNAAIGAWKSLFFPYHLAPLQ